MKKLVLSQWKYFFR